MSARARTKRSAADPAPVRPPAVGAPLAHLALPARRLPPLALLVGGTWAVCFSATLAIEGVEVRGRPASPRATSRRRRRAREGTPLATVDLTAIDRRVSALAAVASVRVTRQWPHDVLIEVTERTPVAVVDRGDGLRAVDAQGAVFSRYRTPPSDLPRITTAAVTDAEALREAATVAGALPDDLRVLVDHIEVMSIDEIDLVLRDGRRVRWGSADRSEQKAEVLDALLPRQGEGPQRQRPRPADHPLTPTRPNFGRVRSGGVSARFGAPPYLLSSARRG